MLTLANLALFIAIFIIATLLIIPLSLSFLLMEAGLSKIKGKPTIPAGSCLFGLPVVIVIFGLTTFMLYQLPQPRGIVYDFFSKPINILTLTPAPTVITASTTQIFNTIGSSTIALSSTATSPPTTPTLLPTSTATNTSTPTALSTPTPLPSPTLCLPLVVVTNPIPVHLGPGFEYKSVGELPFSPAALDLRGRNPENNWFQIAFPASPNGIAWIPANPEYSDYTFCNVASLPVVWGPATFTPIPASTVSPTPTATPTPFYFFDAFILTENDENVFYLIGIYGM